MVVGLVLSYIVVAVYEFLCPGNWGASGANGASLTFLWRMPAWTLALVQLWCGLRYLIDCGTRRERILGLLPVGLLAFVFVLPALLPNVEKVREAAQRTTLDNNLKNIALAIHRNEFDKGAFPPAEIGWMDRGTEQSGLSGAWQVQLLPYMEHDGFPPSRTDQGIASYSYRQEKLVPELTPPFICPADGQSKSSYTAFPDGTWNIHPDGASQTVLAAEAAPWTNRDELPYDSESRLLGFGYGSVRFINQDAEESTWHALITRAGGEVLGPDW